MNKTDYWQKWDIKNTILYLLYICIGQYNVKSHQAFSVLQSPTPLQSLILKHENKSYQNSYLWIWIIWTWNYLNDPIDTNTLVI